MDSLISAFEEKKTTEKLLEEKKNNIVTAANKNFPSNFKTEYRSFDIKKKFSSQSKGSEYLYQIEIEKKSFDFIENPSQRKIRLVSSKTQDLSSYGENFEIDSCLSVNEANFGDIEKCETRIDETVRKGFVIKSFSVGSDYFKDPIQKQIKKDTGLTVTLKEHSINLYPTGGHFKSHVDTPRHDQARMIGTVVYYWGPNFSSRHEICIGENMHFLYPKDYIFFFGNVVHSVPPTNGPKVTLTFDVFIDEKIENFDPLLKNPSLRIFDDWYGKNFLILLEQKYTVHALAQGIMKTETDFKIVKYLRKQNLSFCFVSVLVVDNSKFLYAPREYKEDIELYVREETDFKHEEGIVCPEKNSLETNQLDIYYGEGIVTDSFVPQEWDLKVCYQKIENENVSSELIPIERIFNFGNICETLLLQQEFEEKERIFTGNEYHDGLLCVENHIYLTSAILVNP